MKLSIESLFVAMSSLLYVFMFRCNEKYFNINNYHNGLFLAVAVGTIIIIIYFVKKQIRFNLTMILVLSAIGYMLFSKYILEKETEPFYILFVSVLYLFLACISSLSFKRIQVKHLLDAYIFSSVIMSLILIVQRRTPYSAYGIFRYALFYSENDYYDINFTAMYLLLPTLIGFYIATKCKTKNRLLYLASVVINLLAILLIGSRGTFAPVIAIIAFEIMQDRKVSMGKIAIVMATIFAGTFLLPQDIIERLIGDSYVGTESKRFLDWMYGIRAIEHHPWFGNGLMAPMKIVMKLAIGNGINYTAHNTYLVYMVQMGIIGSIPFILLLIRPLILLWQKKKISFLWLCHCAILFAALMVESNYTYVLIVPLSTIYMLIEYMKSYNCSDGITDIYNQ